MSSNVLSEFKTVRHLYETTFADDALYDQRDWARLEFAASLADGKSVADFGIGPGVLVYSLAETNKFQQIIAVDINTHSRALHHPRVNYYIADLRKPFSSSLGRYDTVFCMEVIEHVEEQHNSQMLSSLRQMAALRLIVTVPFNEPEPLWWHDKPGGHRQRFTLDKISRLFPNAIATIQPRWGVDWLFILEDPRLKIQYFQLIAKKDFTELTSAPFRVGKK